MDYNYGGSSQSPSRFGGFGGGGPQGGGFLASPPNGGGGGGGPLTSPGGGGGAGLANRTLVAVTARQIANCQEPEGQNGVLIDGAEVGQVKVVARIVRFETQSTYCEVHVHDGTAPLEVRYWFDRNDAGDLTADIEGKFREGQYVKIVGKLKYFQNQSTLQTNVMIPITDFNELTYHLLETMYIREMRSSKDQGMAASQNQPQQQFQQQSGYGHQQNVPMNNAALQPFDAGAGGNDALTPLQTQILQVFRQDQSEMGSNIQAVVGALTGQPGASINQIRQDIDFLANEGHVYSTTDEEHFKCT